MKHTPGPWFYRRGDEWSHSVVTHHGMMPDGHENCWAVAEINKNREPEHEANARLISAAPDLLEAAKAVAEHIEGSLPTSGWLRDTDEARAALGVLVAAISKATGEPQ